MEKPFDRAVITGGNFYRLVSVEKVFELWVLAGRHFTKIGDAFKWHAGSAQFVKHFSFYVVGDDLGIGATTVENFGIGITHCFDPLSRFW